MRGLAIFLLVAVTLTATLHYAVCDTVDTVDVSIEVDYSPPEDFTLQPPYYRAASALTLTCVVAEDNGGLFYQWTSTCQGSCFVRGASTQSVSTHALHSRDSGVHTCTVYDGLGCTGNASISVHVAGGGIYVLHGHKVLPNNGIINARTDNRLSQIHCISATQQSNVGNLIGPSGRDITYSTSDPFLVTRSGSHDPGVMHVRTHSAIGEDDEGVYTYRVPNEFNVMMNINVGIYRHLYNGVPEVTNLIQNVRSIPYTITCTSTGSPPTSVVWTKDGEIIEEDSVYKFSKTLVDRRTSTYHNVLTIESRFAVTVADYSCTVNNSFGTSNTMETSIQELEVTGHEEPLIVGLMRKLICSTHLDITLLEWYLVGFDQEPLEESTNATLSLEVDVYSTALDGNEFTCRATTKDGGIHEQTVNIQVKELEHVVVIEAPANPVLAGGELQLTCEVSSDIAPQQVSWMGPGGTDISDVGEVHVGQPALNGNTTTLLLTFTVLKTSHGGQYTCVSYVSNPASNRTATTDVIVKIPQPMVLLSLEPDGHVVYTATPVQLTFSAIIDDSVDTAVSLNSSWTGPSGTLTGSRISIAAARDSNLEQYSHVNLTSLLSSDSGTYTCTASIVPSIVSSFIESSDLISRSTQIEAVLQVEIEVTYTAPDQYPTYHPPEYRTASAVSLRCVAHGTSGSVTYRWSSTCRSPCFAVSSSSQTISDSFLKWYDAGVHTCSVTDSLGNSGSASTEMKIVGAGIYLIYNYWHTGLRSAQPIADNRMLLVDTGRYDHYTYTRVELYCCSNSSRSSIGTFTFPNGASYYYDTGNFDINRQSGSTNTYAGCIHFRIYTRYSYSLPYSGVYTCKIPNAAGETLSVPFGLYSQGVHNQPTSATLNHERSTTHFTLSCRSYSYPATQVTFSRNGVPIVIDQETTRVHSVLISRSSANYNTIFTSSKDPDDLVGNYTCVASNQFGSSLSSPIEVTGIEVSYNDLLVVSETAEFTCTTDLDIILMEWFADGLQVANFSDNEMEVELDSISTDHQGSVYSCVVTSAYGTQERNFTLSVTVPDYWATVEIVNSTGENPINDTSYTLMCTVTGIAGMNLPATIEWVDASGSVITSTQRMTVGEEETVGTITTLTLTFDPVYNRDAGLYSCRASVEVPWMEQQPPVHSASVDMQVTTQAIIQVKFGFVNCLNWEIDRANRLHDSTAAAIEDGVRERCNCNYKSELSIYEYEFSCQSTLLSNQVIYRARINGTSAILTATQILEHIEDWRDSVGSFLYDHLRLKLVQDEACPLHISSFYESECDLQDREYSGQQQFFD